ncbi:hypothetical protein N8368_00165 [Bacteroidia bacterium]|nr:hypothetical protein [Bacteroidia bacterium]MDB9881903.1 hypothetical protein [Bacteroidia bacterium]MDC1394906.1 hypothetical protein [Bacteroidia bacterium]
MKTSRLRAAGLNSINGGHCGEDGRFVRSAEDSRFVRQKNKAGLL